MNTKKYMSAVNHRVGSMYRKALSIVYARQYRALYNNLGLGETVLKV